jgi:KRAB domain-containing zinc finger protein
MQQKVCSKRFAFHTLCNDLNVFTFRFKSQSVYNHHLNTHGSAKNYKCPFCSKAFKTSVQLAGHKNTHTKPFPCHICSRAFASLYAVKAHLKNHRKDEENLKYTCLFCSAQYGRSFALNDHIKAAHGQETDEGDVFVIEEENPGTEEEIFSVVIANDGET